MKWVTWQQIGIDRMACIWLIRNWIDPNAEFSFIPLGAEPAAQDGESFDIPGKRFSHHGGHCTFYSLLHAHKIDDRILARIAQIVDEADEIQQVNIEPAAVGLDLVCRGIRQISKDDFEALEHGSLIYDALYAQLKSEIQD